MLKLKGACYAASFSFSPYERHERAMPIVQHQGAFQCPLFPPSPHSVTKLYLRMQEEHCSDTLFGALRCYHAEAPQGKGEARDEETRR